MMCTALAYGLRAVARNIGRARRWSRDLLQQVRYERGKGNCITAAGLLVFWLAGL